MLEKKIQNMIDDEKEFEKQLSKHTLKVINEKFKGAFEWEKIRQAHELYSEGWRMSDKDAEAIKIYSSPNEYIKLFVENYVMD